MQKLEQVLRAEESARHTISDARERGDAILRSADAEARTLVDAARASAAAKAAELREAALAEALSEATRVEQESVTGLEAQVAGFRARLGDAVSAATALLTE